MDSIKLPCIQIASWSEPAPHIWIFARYKDYQSQLFLARLDTGADMTCIPPSFLGDMASKLPIKGTSLEIQGLGNKLYKAYGKICTICLWDGKEVFASVIPEQGVLISNAPAAFLGMDVLHQFRLEGGNGKWILARL